MTKAVSTILDLFRGKTGIVFPANRLVEATRAVERALAEARVTPGRRLNETDDALFERLVEHLTVRETYFFRDNGQFTEIRERMLPQWRSAHGPESVLRAWSAGCATGEEAYSLAMLFEQEGIRAEVTGTDIARHALADAERGIYDRWSVRGDNGHVLDLCGWTDPPFVVPDRYRSRVRFHYLNLADEEPLSRASETQGMDIVLCRNVLMYFDEDTIRRAARRFYASLAPGGWLITGPSDPPLWDFPAFEPVVTPAGVLYRKGAKGVRPAVARRAAQPAEPRRRSPARRTVPAPKRPPAAAAAKPKSAPQRLDAANSSLVRASADRGDLSGAITAAEAALVGDPASVELHYLRAITLLAAGRDADAFDALRRVIYLDGTLAVAHFVMAALLERMGKIAAARRAYAKASALCADLEDDAILPLSDGESAGRFVAAARDNLARLQSTPAGATAHG